jgi:hypothetical protein
MKEVAANAMIDDFETRKNAVAHQKDQIHFSLFSFARNCIVS